jgi:hypothetical protein
VGSAVVDGARLVAEDRPDDDDGALLLRLGARVVSDVVLSGSSAVISGAPLVPAGALVDGARVPLGAGVAGAGVAGALGT